MQILTVISALYYKTNSEGAGIKNPMSMAVEMRTSLSCVDKGYFSAACKNSTENQHHI